LIRQARLIEFLPWEPSKDLLRWSPCFGEMMRILSWLAASLLLAASLGAAEAQSVGSRAMLNLDPDGGYQPAPSIDLGGDVGLLSRFGGAADGGLLSPGAFNSPYVALNDSDTYSNSAVALGDDVHMRFGADLIGEQHSGYQLPDFSYLSEQQRPLAQSSFAGVDWDFANWGGLGVAATHISESNGLFGGANAGALSVGKSTNTSALGMSAHLGFGDGWVTTFSYSEGITQLSLKSDSLISTTDTLHSRAYGFAVAKHGLFDDDDSLGLAVTRPLQVYGSANSAVADAIDPDLKFGHDYVPLTSTTPETDLELGYVTTFMDGALALQANAGYQMNVAGLGGSNAVSVISRAKINF